MKIKDPVDILRYLLGKIKLGSYKPFYSAWLPRKHVIKMAISIEKIPIFRSTIAMYIYFRTPDNPCTQLD